MSEPGEQQKGVEALKPADILLVEDNDQMARLFEVSIEKMASSQYSIKHVRTQEEAISYLKNNRPRVVVTDLNLKEGSEERHGFEVAKATKRLQPGVPVLLITGRAGELTETQLAENQVDLMARKPYSPSELFPKIEGLILPPNNNS